MANIHTIDEFYGNDRSPMVPQSQTLVQPQYLHDSFWSDNINADEIRQYHPYCIQCGCGCCLGNLMSNERKKDYLRLIKTFTFWMSIVQIIYYIISLIIGGFDFPHLAPSNYAISLLGAKNSKKIMCNYQVCS
jgi:hypothetical protein